MVLLFLYFDLLVEGLKSTKPAVKRNVLSTKNSKRNIYLILGNFAKMVSMLTI